MAAAASTHHDGSRRAIIRIPHLLESVLEFLRGENIDTAGLRHALLVSGSML